VVAAQARLIAKWMSLGFIHGVMNTDNMAISGETIDYGPCAFMDGYDPDKVFSSIDRYGRYAYAAQPQVALWNLAQFASCLIPLIGEESAAVEAATVAINRFAALYEAEWLRLFGAKIGIATPRREDAALIHGLLSLMAAAGADFAALVAQTHGAHIVCKTDEQSGTTMTVSFRGETRPDSGPAA
jgi:uncharacterized protein YdiU (UPF0061 family)